MFVVYICKHSLVSMLIEIAHLKLNKLLIASIHSTFLNFESHEETTLTFSSHFV